MCDRPPAFSLHIFTCNVNNTEIYTHSKSSHSTASQRKISRNCQPCLSTFLQYNCILLIARILQNQRFTSSILGDCATTNCKTITKARVYYQTIIAYIHTFIYLFSIRDNIFVIKYAYRHLHYTHTRLRFEENSLFYH